MINKSIYEIKSKYEDDRGLFLFGFVGNMQKNLKNFKKVVDIRFYA